MSERINYPFNEDPIPENSPQYERMIGEINNTFGQYYHLPEATAMQVLREIRLADNVIEYYKLFFDEMPIIELLLDVDQELSSSTGLSDTTEARLFLAAFKNENAHDKYVEVCLKVMKQGQLCTERMQVFLGAALYGRTKMKKKGRKEITNEFRNSLIHGARAELEKNHNLPLIANVTSKTVSICSVTARVLNFYGQNLSADAVRKVLKTPEPPMTWLKEIKSNRFLSNDWKQRIGNAVSNRND